MHCVAAVWKLSSGSSESTNKVQHQLNISSKQLKDVDPRAKNRHRIAGTAKHLNVLVHVRVYNAIYYRRRKMFGIAWPVLVSVGSAK